MTGIQSQAGVLTADGSRLTDVARKKFVDDVIDKISFGTIDTGFPCGPDINPMPDAALLQDLHDEKKYPAFHSFFLGAYERIAKALNVKGLTPFLPICDPFAIALKLDLPLPDLDLPSIFAIIALPIPGLIPALEIKLPPIQFLLKLKDLIDIPQFPDIPFPNVPNPIPEIGFDALLQFFIDMTFNMPIAALKAMLIELPSLFLDLSVNAIFDLACKSVFGAMPKIPPDLFAHVAATNVLAIKSAECVAFTAIGLTLGCVIPGASSPPSNPPSPEKKGKLADPHPDVPEQNEEEKPVEPQKDKSPASSGVGLVGALGAARGYTDSQVPGESDPDTARAIRNGLMKLEAGENYRRLFLPRKLFYGDPFIVGLVQDLGEHLRGTYGFMLEVGNITSSDRNNKFSASHYGGPVDLAYPYFKPETQERDTGVKDPGAIESDEFEGFEDRAPFRSDIKNIDYQMLYNIMNYLLVIAEDKFPHSVKDGKNNIFVAILIGPEVHTKFTTFMSENGLSLPSTGWAPEKGHDDHIHLVVNRSRIATGDPKVDGPQGKNVEVGENFFIGPPRYLDVKGDTKR